MNNVVANGVPLFTGDLRATSIDLTSIDFRSDRRKCLREGYKMHQASVGGSCFAADAMKAHAPSYISDGRCEG